MGSERWFSAREVGVRFGLCAEAIKKRCRLEWHPKELARMDVDPVTGCEFWVISERADPRLQVREENVGAKLERVSAAKREKYARDCQIFTGWDAARRESVRRGGTNEEGSDAYLSALAEKGIFIEESTLYDWRRNGGPTVDMRGEVQASGDVRDDRMWDFLVRLWKSQKGVNAKACHAMAEAEAKAKGWWAEMSYRTAARKLAELPYGERVFAREGPKAFAAKAAPSITRDYSTLESNEVWCADHSQFDVRVQVGEEVNKATGEVTPIFDRPWLTAWEDMRSRKIVGYLVRAADPNSDAILEALRRGIAGHGVPTSAYTDQGKDFSDQAFTGETKAAKRRRAGAAKGDAERLGGIYASLGIKHIQAWPFNAKAKPIERLFGTVRAGFDRTWDTYCGRDTMHKPEQLADMLKRGKAPKLADFIAAFEAWVETDYHQRVHSGDGMNCTPNQAWEANLRTKRVAAAELLEVLLQRKIGPLKIGKNGVCYKGMRFGQYDLGQLVRREVFIRVDDRDLSKVTVWSLDDKYLCEARCNRKTPFNADHALLREAIADKQREAKVRKGAHDARLHMADDLPDYMLRAAERRNAAARPRPEPTPPDPYSITAVRSDIEGQLKAAEAAAESRPLRRAVGAETMTMEKQMEIYAQFSPE